MKNLLIVCVILSLFASSCSNNSKEQSKTEKEKPVPQHAAEATPVQSFSPILSSYFDLKNALVETDAAKARSNSVRLVSALEQADIKGEIIKHADAVAGSEDVQYQRAEFEKISKEIYEMTKKSKLGAAVVYKQYCPMAFDNKGAFWLSSDEKIMNPYFGDKMLHCGKVEETIVVN